MLVDRDSGIPAAPASNGSGISNLAPAGSSPLFNSPRASDGASITDAKSVIEWVKSSDINDDMIGYFAQKTARAAEEHASNPPHKLLDRVQKLHTMIQILLQSGKQRHRQVGDLLRLDSDLLAHLCQLLGDVHRDPIASWYAEASIALGNEAGSGSAAAFSAQSQMARWRGHYVEATDLAAKGLESSPPPALRTLLAYQEADAAAASGQMRRRASLALQKADAMDDAATAYSAWSCPPARRALFRMGVALNLGDPSEALRQAEEAESIWEHEKPLAFGTWAHFQIAAAKAHIALDSVDGAIQQVAPVLDLPHEYRISTLAGHLGTLDALLLDQRFNKSRQVASLRGRLASFAVGTADAAQKEKE
jgi:hypothetical protein